jgi:arylsulfatase
MTRSLGIVLPWCETFAIGIDTGTPVHDKDYQVPFQFNRQDQQKLTLKLGLEELAPADKETLSKASRAKQ